MKTFKNITILGYNGKTMELIINEKGDKRDLTMVDVMQAILNNTPIKTMQDSINGMRLQIALDKAKDGEDIILEEGIHDWLKPIAEQLCPTLFRINAQIMYHLIKEGFEKQSTQRKKLS